MKRKKEIIQCHHIIYASDEKVKDWIVEVTKGEHFLITQLQRFKSLSDGAMKAILYELAKKNVRDLVK